MNWYNWYMYLYSIFDGLAGLTALKPLNSHGALCSGHSNGSCFVYMGMYKWVVSACLYRAMPKQDME